MPANKKAAAKAKGNKRPVVKVTAAKQTKKPVPVSVREKVPKRATVADTPHSDEQFQFFEKGIQLFNKGQFKLAQDCFKKATSGTSASIAHAADLRLRLCEQRLSRSSSSEG